MSKPNCVMVGIDGSTHAEAAVDKAIDLAKRYDAALYIIHVYDASTEYYTVPGGSKFTVPDVVRSFIEPFFVKYAKRARDMGVRKVYSRIIAIPGNAGTGLVAEAERRCPAIVVVGTRGITGISRTVMGSTAEYVTRNSPCDVYITKE